MIFLVAHHLDHVPHRPAARHRRPQDVEPLAELCRTPERLRMLYLLTCADMRAVGPGRDDRLAGARSCGSSTRAPSLRLTGGQLERPRATRGPAGDARRARRGAAQHAGRPPRHALRPLPRHHPAPAHRRPPAARRAAGAGAGGHRALPPSRSRLLRAGHRHPRRARALLADRGHARRAGHQHPLRPDPHARRRHRHRHLPGQRSLRRGGDGGGALAPRRSTRCAACSRARRRWRSCSRGAAAGRAAPTAVGAAQDLPRQPALRHPYRGGGQVPRPGRASLRHHAHALSPASTSAARASPPRSIRPTTLSTSRTAQGRRVEDRPPMGRLREALEDALAASRSRCSSHYQDALRHRPTRSRGCSSAGARRPNHLTVVGLGVSIVAACVFVAGRLRSGAALLTVAGLFDFFDGRWRASRGRSAPSAPSSTRWWTATRTSSSCSDHRALTTSTPTRVGAPAHHGRPWSAR